MHAGGKGGVGEYTTQITDVYAGLHDHARQNNNSVFLGHSAIVCQRIRTLDVRQSQANTADDLNRRILHAPRSTDPAHNLSDAFSQKFSKDATQVNGYSNLYAMEIDPSGSMQEMIDSNEGGQMGGMLQDLAFAIPGVDEAMGFAEIMKWVWELWCAWTWWLCNSRNHHHPALCHHVLATQRLPMADRQCSHRHVKSMQYSVIIFDTAPTGHTLRFLSFPSVLEKALAKLSTLSGKFGPMMQSVRFASYSDYFV